MWNRTLMAVLLLLAPVGAFSQEISQGCPSRPKKRSVAKRVAGKWFNKGSKLVAQEQYQKAIGAFLCSLRIVDHPATIYNVAQAAHLAGELDVALEYALQYLEQAPDGEMIEEVRELIETLDSQLSVKEAGDEGGGAPAPDRPTPTPVIAEPAESTDEEPVALSPPRPNVRDEGKYSKLTLIGYASLGLGGAALLTGGIFQAMAGQAQSEGEATGDYHVFKDAKDKMRSRQIGAIVGFATAGVAVGTGIALILADRSDDEVAGVSITPTVGGLSIEGRF